ncbi:MAG: PAS domain-containing protein [Actinobacteria bacterium]|nr:PAS domain-containing protein [Actinomycetota bacterium]MBO0786830.1 PAS domain-containing protein [Actinomycetota bacterium]
MSTPPHNGDLETLLEYLFERRNFDFRAYKRASLSRRIFKRMQTIGVEDYQRYMEVLEANPGEFAELFNTILINVTSLLRDRDAWGVLASRVIPAIVGAKTDEQPIRVWSAGCASGEEAYSLAVLFAEALGEERFRQSVKIYATDADNDALADARHGRYRESDLVEAFGEERTGRFFERDGSHGVFRGDLRRALIFGRHDLVQDPPISRIDLLTCRNTLMYFTSEVQGEVLTSFHFALNPGAYLFLGKSEALVTRTQMFEVVDLRQHIVRKGGSGTDIALLTPLQAGRGGRPAPREENVQPGTAAFEQGTVPQVMLDANGIIVLANRAARRTFALGSAELGRHLREVELSFRPADLRTPAERVLRERREVTVFDVTWHVSPDDAPTYDIVISPLEAPAGALISFLEVTRYQHLREELEHSRRELETAYEELQSTVEELETTNEELQSTNEELETTNEELHSTNEELETMNEELQSTNEELETINNEVRERSSEVTELNQFLQSILGSLQSAVVVLGTQMEIRAWNRQAEELWGLRGDEVLGHHFLNLDIGFPVDRLRTGIRNCLAGRSEREQVVQPAVNRRGRPIEVTVSLSPLHGAAEARGVILMMDAVAATEPASPDGQSRRHKPAARPGNDGPAAG